MARLIHEIVKEIVKEADEPITSKEVWRRAQKHKEGVNYSTVRRHLQRHSERRTSKVKRIKKMVDDYATERKFYHYFWDGENGD